MGGLEPSTKLCAVDHVQTKNLNDLGVGFFSLFSSVTLLTLSEVDVILHMSSVRTAPHSWCLAYSRSHGLPEESKCINSTRPVAVFSLLPLVYE